MKILFVQPSARTRFPEPPIGLAVLISIALLKKCHIEIYQEDRHFKSLDYEKIIREFCPDIVAVSFMTSQYPFAVNLINRAKTINSDLKIIIGGVHPTALPDETISDFSSVDYLCFGEGEKTFDEFIDYCSGKKIIEDIDGLIYRKNGKVFKNSKRKLMSVEELNSLPMPPWDILYKNGLYENFLSYSSGLHPVFPIITARGCPYDCSFCAEKTIWENKLRERNINLVFEEVQYLNKKFNAIHFNILDDTFTLKMERVRKFCENIINSGMKISWRCTAKVQTVNVEILSLMKKAGCKLIAYGVESGNQDVLDLMNKKQNLKDVKNAFRMTKEAGIKSFALCMVGNIGEDFEAVKKTADFIAEIDADLFSCAIMTPYPGTKNYDTCKKNNWIIHHDWEKWVPTPINIKEFVPVTRTDKMDKDLMLKSYYYLNKRFMFSKFRKKYGQVFFLNFKFYYEEVFRRLRYTGILGFIKHFFKLFKS